MDVFSLCPACLCFMVYQSLQKTLFAKTSLAVQLGFLVILTTLLFVLEGEGVSFLLGIAFSYIYSGLFFYSIQFLFIKEKKSLGFLLLFSKWIFLLAVLIALSQYFSGASFLLGAGMIPAILLTCIRGAKEKMYKFNQHRGLWNKKA